MVCVLLRPAIAATRLGRSRCRSTVPAIKSVLRSAWPRQRCWLAARAGPIGHPTHAWRRRRSARPTNPTAPASSQMAPRSPKAAAPISSARPTRSAGAGMCPAKSRPTTRGRGLLVRRGFSWPQDRQRRSLRHERADGGASDVALAIVRLRYQPQQRPHRARPDQRPRSLRQRPADRPIARRLRACWGMRDTASHGSASVMPAAPLSMATTSTSDASWRASPGTAAARSHRRQHLRHER